MCRNDVAALSRPDSASELAAVKPPVVRERSDGRSQVFPPHHARKIWWISWLCAVSALIAAACAPRLAACPAVVLATSLNYWRRPGPGFRRTLDIIMVHLCAVICIWHSFELSRTHWLGYWLATGAGMVSYFVGCMMGENLEVAVRCHMALHALANVGNWFLFVGLRPAVKPDVEISWARVLFLGSGAALAAVFNVLPEEAARKVLLCGPIVPLLLVSLQLAW